MSGLIQHLLILSTQADSAREVCSGVGGPVVFVSEQGVSSCDHPLWVMEAVPREDPILALQLGGLRTHQTPLWTLNQEKGDLVRAPTVHSCEMFGGQVSVVSVTHIPTAAGGFLGHPSTSTPSSRFQGLAGLPGAVSLCIPGVGTVGEAQLKNAGGSRAKEVYCGSGIYLLPGLEDESQLRFLEEQRTE